MKDIFNPSAIIIESQSKQIKNSLIAKSINYSDIKKINALERAPNIKKKNGQINCEGLFGNDDFAITVSPFNKKFKTQIEDGVWPFVKLLLDKNYMTMSSCQGHSCILGGDSFHFILAIPNEEKCKELQNKFNKIKNCKAFMYTSVCNVSINLKSNSPYNYKAEKLINSQQINLEEYEDINNLYCRNYERYYFLQVYILFGEQFYPLISKNFIKSIIYRVKFYLAKKNLHSFMQNQLPVSEY